MKLCFIARQLDSYGAPKMLAWVANSMSKSGHDVEIVTFFSDEIKQPLEPNVRFHYLGLKMGDTRLKRNTVGMISVINALVKHIRQEKPDIVISFLDSIGYVFLAVNKLLLRKKVVVSERVDPNQYKGFKSKLRFWLMSFADGFVFQTNGAKDFFGAKIRNCADVIPNPVTTSYLKLNKPCSFDRRDNRIVTVGRLDLTQKRQDVLLRAFKIVHQLRPELTLHIYGDGKDRERIVTLIEQLGLSDCAFLEGRTDNVERNIHSARAFVLTSDFEGIPNALIEAMSMGVPVVSTDCSPGGAELLIQDGNNGYLVPCGDFEKLSERIIEVCRNKEISNRFSQNSPKIAFEFSEDVIAQKWEIYFSKVAEGL